MNVLKNFKLTDLKEKLTKKYDYLLRVEESGSDVLHEQEKFCKCIVLSSLCKQTN